MSTRAPAAGQAPALQADDAAAPRTERRLEALEIKASYAEDLLEQLNLTVYAQQQTIDRLQRELRAVVGQLQELRDGLPRGAADERPPHY
ncbi:hypothetical protein GCM10023090_29710 [Acidovorax lacteus]|uniref:SlyX family protein n=1 Tax=Acidovorax lacteus TaxID=1924988 RepID=A0ABP8LH03_9BURK